MRGLFLESMLGSAATAASCNYDYYEKILCVFDESTLVWGESFVGKSTESFFTYISSRSSL